MDENHIGLNINTIPVQMACNPVGKQCLCDGKVFGSIPGAGNLHDYM